MGEGSQGGELAPVWAGSLSVWGVPPSPGGALLSPCVALLSHILLFLDSLSCFGEAEKRCLGDHFF